MELNLDSHTVDLPCPACGQKLTKTIGWLKAHQDLTCTCGQTITLDLTQFKQGVARAQKGLDGLSAAVRKLGKR